MGSKTSTVQTPYQNNNTVSYGYQSAPGINPEEQVKKFQDVQTNPDPGVGGRTDLSLQANKNRWDNTFMAGLPYYLRQRVQDSEARSIGLQGNLEQQQAEYMSNQQNLAKQGALLPQLTQTGGSSSGYNTQVVQTQSPWAQLAGSAMGMISPIKI